MFQIGEIIFIKYTKPCQYLVASSGGWTKTEITKMASCPSDNGAIWRKSGCKSQGLQKPGCWQRDGWLLTDYAAQLSSGRVKYVSIEINVHYLVDWEDHFLGHASFNLLYRDDRPVS